MTINRQILDISGHISHMRDPWPEVCAYDVPVSWWEYVTRIADTGNQTEIAKRLGLSQPSVNRWKTVIPKSENVISFAKAYGRPPIEALQAAGLVTDEDIELIKVPLDYAELSLPQLVKELNKVAAEIRKRVPD